MLRDTYIQIKIIIIVNSSKISKKSITNIDVEMTTRERLLSLVGIRKNFYDVVVFVETKKNPNSYLITLNDFQKMVISKLIKKWLCLNLLKKWPKILYPYIL